MRSTLDPVFMTPRMLPRRWGRQETSAWCAHAPKPAQGLLGEIWLAHPHNMTSEQRHLGALLADAPGAMMGDLGRAPPSLRLILTDEPTDLVFSDGPLSLWSMLESPLTGALSVQDRPGAGERAIGARYGDLLRAEAGVSLRFGAGVAALEVRANFTPTNAPRTSRLRRIARPAETDRTAWFRDPALSVERWTLPEMSFLEPDGETCHVIFALTPGVMIGERSLARGEAVLIPAHGNRVTVTGRGAQVLACYPDVVPTQIWKHGKRPSPAMRASMRAAAEAAMPLARAAEQARPAA